MAIDTAAIDRAAAEYRKAIDNIITNLRCDENGSLRVGILGVRGGALADLWRDLDALDQVRAMVEANAWGETPKP